MAIRPVGGVGARGVLDGQVRGGDVDAGIAEAGPFDAAPSDAQDDGAVDAGPGFCSTHPGAIFCADFDESADPASGWTATNVSDGGALSTTTTGFVSPPRAFQAAIDSAAQSTAFAFFAYPAVMPAKTIEADIAISGGAAQFATVLTVAGFTPDAGPEYQLAFGLELSASDYNAILAFGGAGDGGTSVTCTLFNASSANVPHHYVVSFATAGQITLTRSGDVGSDAGAQSCSVLVNVPPSPGGEALSIGVTGGGAATTVRVDNLLMSAQ